MLIPSSTINFFLPDRLQHHLYTENVQARTVVTGLLIAALGLAVLTAPLAFFVPITALYYIPVLMCFAGLLYIRQTGNLLGGAMMAIVASYIVVLYIIVRSGGIFSVHITSLYILLMIGFWMGPRLGYWITATHLVAVCLIYLVTDAEPEGVLKDNLHSKEYALLFRWLLCLFFALLFSFTRQAQEEVQNDIKRKQLMEMEVLRKRLRKKRRMIEEMRKSIARDFHDETGSILSSIGQQANLLKIRMDDDSELVPVIDQINRHCEELMASSRDFMWSLNNESDNPMVVFEHLTDFAQDFFNQFDIAFFGNPMGDGFHDLLKMDAYASRNLILIFKEAMTNIARHSGATHVKLEMYRSDDAVSIRLKDNGRWKDADPSRAHYGLKNMEERARKNQMGFRMKTDATGTCVELSVPVTIKTEALTNELL